MRPIVVQMAEDSDLPPNTGALMNGQVFEIHRVVSEDEAGHRHLQGRRRWTIEEIGRAMIRMPSKPHASGG